MFGVALLAVGSFLLIKKKALPTHAEPLNGYVLTQTAAEDETGFPITITRGDVVFVGEEVTLWQYFKNGTGLPMPSWDIVMSVGGANVIKTEQELDATQTMGLAKFSPLLITRAGTYHIQAILIVDGEEVDRRLVDLKAVMRPGATLFESFVAPGQVDWAIYGPAWLAQTFTPVRAHRITSVRLLLNKEIGVYDAGPVEVSIRATSGAHPSGPDLCFGSTDGDTLKHEPSREWREIFFEGGCDLQAYVKYAIVVRAPSASYESHPQWRREFNATYPRGNFEFSSNFGVTWASAPNDDMIFEEWGL